MLVVDAHEDLAWNMLTFQRDYRRSVKETRAREASAPWIPHVGHTLLGLPEWRAGKVALVFATLFAAPARRRKHAWDVVCYEDEAQAERLYRQQMDLYLRWTEENQDFQLVTHGAQLENLLQAWQGAPAEEAPIGLVLLMEGAEGLGGPQAVEAWVERGLRILGPAWAGNRYVGGTGEPGPLTAEGRALLEAMAECHLILDISHMAEEGALEALESYPGLVIASHSNPRALLADSPVPDRHLADLTIRLLAERGGVMGIVPYNRFLVGGWTPAEGRERVSLDHVVAHIDHVCQLLGSAEHVGLGTDFDGGVGLHLIPHDLDSIADMGLIGEALLRKGYRPSDVEAILGANWLRILRAAFEEL